MSNFKLSKLSPVFLVSFFVILMSANIALAGFISISDDDPAQNEGVVPANIDGEIANCFDYYHFPSIQASFTAVKESYEPGQTVYFKGNLINENSYPIADGYLFVRVARFNENYTQEGHDIADEFFAQSGPQDREKFYLESNETKPVVFSWNVPENLPDGNYIASFNFVVGKKMNLSGLSFTNEVTAGSVEFEVKKSAVGAQRVFLEKPSFVVNNEKYDHIGLWPLIDKGAKVAIAGKLKNDTAQKAKVKLVYDLFYWDGLDDKNKISSQSEDIIVAPNSSRSLKYAIPAMNETVYFLRITAVSGNNQKSVVNLRFVSEQERPRINFFSPMKFPLLKGETTENFVCFHNTADGPVEGKVLMNVFDKSGNEIQTLGYEGEITGFIMAVKKEMTALNNYDYLRMTASVAGADGRETDSYEMIYDCENMDPANRDCAKIRKENVKAIGAVSSDKKAAMLGAAALIAMLIIAFLLKKFFFKKNKSLLTFLFLTLAIGLTVFLAEGVRNHALAESVKVSQDYQFPSESLIGDCIKGDFIQTKGFFIFIGDLSSDDHYGYYACVEGKIDINHIVTRDITKDVLAVDEKIIFNYGPENPFYYATMGAGDSPFGTWCDNLDNQSCRDSTYEEITAQGSGKTVRQIKGLLMTWLAVKPEIVISSSDESVITCSKMVCVAKKKGAAVLTANIPAVTARPWLKFPAPAELKLLGVSDWEATTGYKTSRRAIAITDIILPNAALTWNIVVESLAPSCGQVKFEPEAINSGDSTQFSWEVFDDEDGIVPITCSNEKYNYTGASKGSFSINPTENITCKAIAENSKGKAKCSAEVTVKPPPPPPPPSPLSSISVSCSASPVSATASDEEKTKRLNSFCDDCGDSDKLSTEWITRLGGRFPFTDFLTTEQFWDVKKIGPDIYATGGVNSVSNAEDYDLVLGKYGEDGSLKWKKTWSGGPRDGGLVLAADDSSVYVGGLVREEIAAWWGLKKDWTNRALLQKYDFDGNLKWTKVWGDIPDGHHEIDGLAVVGRDLYVSHWDSTNGFRKIQAVVKKLNLDELNKSASNDRLLRPEQIKWSKSYGDADKVTTADGHIYADDTGVWITGVFNVSPKTGSWYFDSAGDAYLAKIGSDGEGEWLKTFNFKDEHGYDGYNDGFNLVSDGQYLYIAGVTASSGILNDWDAMIAKFDKNGKLIWKKSPRGAGSELARGIAVDDQYLYVAHGVSDKGGSGWDTVLAKYDKNSGNLVKFNYWGESGADLVTSSLAFDQDNKFVYLAGKTTSGAADKDKDFDALLIKASEKNSNGGRAIFEAIASGGKPPYLYSWSGTDNLSGSDSMVTKSYSTEGIKEAIIAIKDNSIPQQTAENTCAIKVTGSTSTTTTIPPTTTTPPTTTIPPTTTPPTTTIPPTTPPTPTTPTTTTPPAITPPAITPPPPLAISNFTFSVFSGNPLLATIVEGLPANSTVAVLALSGETIGNITVSANLSAVISGATAQFAVSADNGNTWSAWSNAPLNNVDTNAISKIRIRFKVPGVIPAGTYTVTISAKDDGEGGQTIPLNLNLKVERITSGWIEY